MKRPIWPLVAAILLVCYLGGQAEHYARGAGHQLHEALGVAGAVLGTLAVAALVGLASYLHHGHWHPFRGRQAGELAPMTEEEYRALMTPGGIREEADGVWSGPPKPEGEGDVVQQQAEKGMDDGQRGTQEGREGAAAQGVQGGEEGRPGSRPADQGAREVA